MPILILKPPALRNAIKPIPLLLFKPPPRKWHPGNPPHPLMVIIPRRDRDKQQRAHRAQIRRAARDTHPEKRLRVPTHLPLRGARGQRVAQRNHTARRGERERGFAHELCGAELRRVDRGIDDRDAQRHIPALDRALHRRVDDAQRDSVLRRAAPGFAELDWVGVGLGDRLVGVEMEDLGEVLRECEGGDCVYVGGEDGFADVEFWVFQEGVEGFGKLDGVV